MDFRTYEKKLMRCQLLHFFFFLCFHNAIIAFCFALHGLCVVHGAHFYYCFLFCSEMPHIGLLQQEMRNESCLEARKTGMHRVGERLRSFPTQQVFRLIRNQKMRVIICCRSSKEMGKFQNIKAFKCARKCTTVGVFIQEQYDQN